MLFQDSFAPLFWVNDVEKKGGILDLIAEHKTVNIGF
jgi:hypothetical protein